MTTQVGSRGVVACLVLALALAGCGLLDGSEVADCDTVRVAFEDALGQVRGPADVTTDGDQEAVEQRTFDEESLRRVVELHDQRRECFAQDTGEFLDPAREVLGEERPDVLELVPPRDETTEAPGAMLGESRYSTGD